MVSELQVKLYSLFPEKACDVLLDMVGYAREINCSNIILVK